MNSQTAELTKAIEDANRLLETGRFKEAVEHLRRAISLHPDSVALWCLLAHAYLGLNAPAKALEAARHALLLAPDDEWPHRIAASALQLLGRVHESSYHAREAAKDRPAAKAAPRRALAISPQSPPGESAPGNLEAVLGVFLARAAYLIILDAYLLTHLGSARSVSGDSLVRLLSVIVLVVPAAYAWRFASRLAPSLRAYLVSLLRRRGQIAAAAALEVLAVACLCASAATDADVSHGLAGGAAASAVIGRLILWAQLQSSITAARDGAATPLSAMLSMWVVAIALLTMAGVTIFAAVTSRAGMGGIVFAALCLLAACVIVWRIARRIASAMPRSER